jgi:probable rRNA maturation factor
MPSIRFFYEDTPFRLEQVNRVKSWIKKTVTAEAKKLISINYIFCSDSYLLDINIQYLSHNTLTDIVTFDVSGFPNDHQQNKIEGEIYISIDRVRENAMKFDIAFNDELHRVIIHGVLHLVGYSDKTPRKRALMRKKEDAYLSLRDF